MDVGNVARKAAIAKYGLDTMYCENTNGRLETWTYSDGVKVPLHNFYAREAMNAWAERNRFGIIFVD